MEGLGIGFLVRSDDPSIDSNGGLFGGFVFHLDFDAPQSLPTPPLQWKICLRRCRSTYYFLLLLLILMIPHFSSSFHLSLLLFILPKNNEETDAAQPTLNPG